MAEDLPDRADADLSRSLNCSSKGSAARADSPARADHWHAPALLTCCSACRRSLLGRIEELESDLHAVVQS